MRDFKIYQASGYLTKLVTDASDVRKEYEEISGSLVQFDAPISAPLASLIVDINPVQDLNGQDAPYPPNGGVNKFDGTSWNTYIPLHLNVGDKIIAQCNVDEDHTNAYFVVRTYDSDKNFLQSFTNNQGTTTRVNKITITDEAEYIQAQTSTPDLFSNIIIAVGDYQIPMEYTPYSNICPITGWTGANIYHSGEDTSNPTVYTVSWQDEAGTVYGGTVDVVTGILTVDMASVDLGTLTWQKYAQSNTWIFYANVPSGRTSVNGGAIKLLCSVYPCSQTSKSGSQALESSDKLASWDNTNSQILIKDLSYSDAASFKTAMSGVQLVYELATSTEIQITPEEINTLIGVNNIWADTGDVSVKYRTH